MAAAKFFHHASAISLTALIALTAACKQDVPATPPEPTTTTEAAAPNEELDTASAEVSSYSDGTPGSVSTATEQLTATVAELDREKRLVVLQDEAGHRRQIQVPPEMVNFDQVNVGDVVHVAASVETIVALQEPGTDTDEQSGVAARAEKGEQPGMFLAERTQVTATVEAVDIEKHTATLKFADGSSRTVAVRPDVVLSQDQVGKQVLIIVTSSIAASVEKVEKEAVN